MPDKPDPKFDNLGARTSGLGLRGHMTLGHGLGIDFQDHFRLFDELVANRGEIIIHEMAIACPTCRTGDTSDPVFFWSDCTSCEGNGFIYRNPRYIQALVTNISQSRDLGEFGFSVPGDCLISPAPNLRPQIAEFDRITFTWPQTVNEGQVVVRGADYARFKERGNPNTITSDEDVLHYEAANALHVEDSAGNNYYQDADFIFESKVIRWISSNKPIIRSRYVIKYEAYLQWIAISPPQERRDNGRNLGPRVAMRKVHMFKSGEDPKQDTAADRAADNPFGNKVTV